MAVATHLVDDQVEASVRNLHSPHIHHRKFHLFLICIPIAHLVDHDRAGLDEELGRGGRGRVWVNCQRVGRVVGTSVGAREWLGHDREMKDR